MAVVVARDPEVTEILRQQLRLVIRSERVLTQLEDHTEMLRTFVDKADTELDEHDHEGDHDANG